MKKLIMPLVLSGALLSGSAQAATTVYTDKTAFQNATTGTTLEDFNDATLAMGVTSTNGTLVSSRFSDTVNKTGATTTFTFSGAVQAIGGLFNLTPGGGDQGIAFLLDGAPLPGIEVPNGTNGFWGFISDTPFTTVTLLGGSQSGNQALERYTLDDLIFGLSAAAVPEPSSWAMLIFGLGAVGAGMRRRNAVKLTYRLR